VQLCAERKTGDATQHLGEIQQEILDHAARMKRTAAQQAARAAATSRRRLSVNKHAAKMRAMSSMSKHRSEVTSMAKEVLFGWDESSGAGVTTAIAPAPS
jgi:hypothetical protein